jgi:hypothetical protein
VGGGSGHEIEAGGEDEIAEVVKEGRKEGRQPGSRLRNALVIEYGLGTGTVRRR